MEDRKKQSYSLKKRIIKVVLAGALFTFVLLLFTGIYMRRKLGSEVARQYKDILDMQIAAVDERLDYSESVLLTWNINAGAVNELKKCNDRDQAERIMVRIRSLFNDAAVQGNICELFFVTTDREEKITRMTLNGNFRPKGKQELEEYVRGLDSDFMEKNSWQLVLVGDTWYFFYLSYEKGVGLGQAVRLDTILESLGMHIDAHSVLTARGDDGKFLTRTEWIESKQLTFQSEKREDYYFTEGNCLIVKGVSEKIETPIYFMQEGLLSGDFNKIIAVLYIVAICICIISIITFWGVYDSLQKSLSILKETMLEIRNGGMEAKIDLNRRYPVEYMETFHVFNDMLERIRHFRIVTYETELERKNYEIQYLSLQIEPHFYLNAMKCIYALAQKKEFEKIQKLILDLSDYYRYLTYDHSGLVELRDELQHVESYLSVIRIGRKQNIETVLELDNRASRVKVPKLLVQTFIENASKYGMVEGQDLVIHVIIHVLESEEEAYLSLVVKDNGRGFDSNFLELVERKGFLGQEGHVGLSNLWNRLQLIYGDKAYMNIKNLEDCGAYTEVMLPICTESEERQEKI